MIQEKQNSPAIEPPIEYKFQNAEEVPPLLLVAQDCSKAPQVQQNLVGFEFRDSENGFPISHVVSFEFAETT